MANLTISVDDDLLLRARVRALQQGTSVNALLRAYLESYAGVDAMEARQRLVELAHRVSGSSGERGRSWTRDELHER